MSSIKIPELSDDQMSDMLAYHESCYRFHEAMARNCRDGSLAAKMHFDQAKHYQEQVAILKRRLNPPRRRWVFIGTPICLN